MANDLTLTDQERNWRDELVKLRASFNPAGDFEQRIKSLEEMRDVARQLHRSLKEHGHEPKHHRYMIENRGCQPDDPEFYLHLHPIEDLIKFSYNPHANDDPVD